MPKLHNPFIRIQITEVTEGAPGDSLRDASYKLVKKDFQTRKDALQWMNSQGSIRNFSEDLADAVDINM